VPLFYRLIDRGEKGGRQHGDEEEANDSSNQSTTNKGGDHV